MQQIQTAGKRLSGIHCAQSLHLRGWQFSISRQCFLQRGVFLDIQRTSLLNILCHIEVINEGCWCFILKVFYNGAVDGHFPKLFICKGNQVLEGKGFQLLFNEFLQRIIAAPVNNDTVHIPIQAELHEIHIDLNRDLIIRDGAMTHRNIPQIKVVTRGIKFCLAVGIDQFGGLCKQRMDRDAGLGQIGIVGHVHPLGHGTLLKYKVG